MTQPNLQVDGIRVQPGSGQTLTITRDNATGSLRFVDAVVTAGLNLSQLAGLSTISGVLLVGASGSGAQYTDPQVAINAVPASASLINPYVILMAAGVYTTPLTITKPGIILQALGRVVIQPAVPSPCVTVLDAVTTFPTSLTLRGLTLIQPGVGLACVKLIGGTGSTVGADGIVFEDCDLLPTGVGGFTIDADAVNYVVLRGCQTSNVPVSASMRITQCAGLTVSGGSLPAVQADYNSAGVIPSVVGSSYTVSGCTTVGNVLSTLTGAGSLAIQSCPAVGTVTMNGNRTLGVSGSNTGNLALNGTTAATLQNSSRGTVAGTGTLLESQSSGTSVFVASLLETVVFPVARPNANYTVTLDTGIIASAFAVAKTVNGFDITFVAPVSTTVFWTILS